MRVVTKRKRPPRMITCPDCNGAHESVAVTGMSRDGAPMPGIEIRNVACETCGCTGKVADRKCPCCGAAGRGICKPCKDAHGGERNVYIARLTCPVNDRSTALQAELEEAFEPGSTLPPFGGHSDECWTRMPHEGIDTDVKARCPVCSQPRPEYVHEKLTMTETRTYAASLDMSRGPRAPR